MTTARISTLFAALTALAGCQFGQSSAISDSEIDSIRTARSALTSATDNVEQTGTAAAATPGVFHLRLAWGYLAHRQRPTGWVNWTGTAALSSGTMKQQNVIFFEKGDFAIASDKANAIAWQSKTLPHFDGTFATAITDEKTQTLSIDTPVFKKELAVAELLAGAELRFPVDVDGHELSVSTIPDEAPACSGFSLGFLRANGDGFDFGGIVTNTAGEKLGKLRFATDAKGAATGAVTDLTGQTVAKVEGTVDAVGQAFSLTLTRTDAAASTVRGLFRPATYSNRGSFQASLRCQ